MQLLTEKEYESIQELIDEGLTDKGISQKLGIDIKKVTVVGKTKDYEEYAKAARTV